MITQQIVDNLEWLLAPPAALAGAVGFMTYAVRGHSAQVFGKSVWRGDRRRPAVALTFDDGPSERTPDLLEVLDRYGAKATFFMCGQNVQRVPDVARDVLRGGHEIGNHTDTHPRLDFKTSDFIYQEFTRAQGIIKSHTGVLPVWLRAPFGVKWFGLGTAQRRANLTGVMWSLSSRDWKLPIDEIVGRIEAARNGDIILMHDGRGLDPNPDISATIQAVKTIVPRLQDRGLEFQTVSQLVCPKAP